MEKSNYKDSLLWKILVNVSAVLLGLVFIFSGFVKAVDPLGTCYKIQDYIEAFGLSQLIPDFLPLMLSVALCCLEFMIGIMMLLRVRKRIASILVLVMMLVMTPLTFYLALTNPISDCGCFGDALVLTNWQTFYKNVVLLLCAIVVFIGYDKLGDLLSRKKEWMVTTWSFIFILGMALYALYYIPVFDFRPYKVGVNIPQAMEIPEDAELSEYDTRFVMEKDGVRKEFGLDDYPDSTWTFIESKTVLLKQGYEPPIHDFSLMSFETGEDMTSDILEHRGYTFLLVVHRVEEADDSDIDLVNEVFDYSVEHGYPFYALTSSPAEEIEAWRENTGAEYEFFLADDIVLKTIIRSNPGLLLLKDGTILNKWSNKSLPDEFALSAPLDQVELVQQKVINNPMRYLIIFFIFIVPLSLLLGQDLIRKQMRKNKN